MKIILILALIIAVCTCSVDVPETVKLGKEGGDSKSLSFYKKGVMIDQTAGTTTLDKKLQEDDDVRDYKKLEKRLTENTKGELQKMRGRAKSEGGLACRFLETRLNEQKNPLRSEEKNNFKGYLCRSFGLSEKARYGTVKKAYDLVARVSSESSEPPLFSNHEDEQFQKLFDIVKNDMQCD
jgi:hypothetical protein